MITIIAYAVMTVGIFFCLIAAIGTFRFKDVYCRMHAATKAGAFGVSKLLMGVNILEFSWRSFLTSILIIFFFYLTAPIAAHLIGRAAYRSGIKADPRTSPDEYNQSWQ